MDSRFPTHYLNDRRVLRASTSAFRQFVLGTAWSVSNMTDGLISREDLPLVTFSSTENADELVRLGLWDETEDGYIINDFEKHQTSAAVMEASLINRRKSERERQARKRAKDKEATEPPMSQGQSRDGHVTSEGKAEAEARQGKDEETPPSSEEGDVETGELTSTPTADFDSQIRAAWNDPLALLEVGQAIPAGDSRKQSAHDRYRELTARSDSDSTASKSSAGPVELFGDAPVPEGFTAFTGRAS